MKTHVRKYRAYTSFTRWKYIYIWFIPFIYNVSTCMYYLWAKYSLYAICTSCSTFQHKYAKTQTFVTSATLNALHISSILPYFILLPFGNYHLLWSTLSRCETSFLNCSRGRWAEVWTRESGAPGLIRRLTSRITRDSSSWRPRRMRR